MHSGLRELGPRLWRGALPVTLCTLLLGCPGPELALFLAQAPARTFQRSETHYPWPNALGPENAPLEGPKSKAIGEMRLAWTVRTGDGGTVFQNTPILAQGRLLACAA